MFILGRIVLFLIGIGILIGLVAIGFALKDAFDEGDDRQPAAVSDVDRDDEEETPSPTPRATDTPPPTTLQATATAVPTDTPEPTPSMEPSEGPGGQPAVSNGPFDGEGGRAKLLGSTKEWQQGNWNVTLYEGATDQMDQWFRNLQNPDPARWPSFPNVPNPLVPEFRVVNGSEVPDGLEYGLDERNFCDNDICDLVVDARSYHLVTGDYDLGFISCKAENGIGCAFAVFNVGNETANFENIHVNNGFSLTGRYWNGDTLWMALWGLSSHVIANMTNFPTNGAGDDTLNDPDRTNAGTNCSDPAGCGGVHFTFVITSGNHVLAIAQTTFTR